MLPIINSRFWIQLFFDRNLLQVLQHEGQRDDIGENCLTRLLDHAQKPRLENRDILTPNPMT